MTPEFIVINSLFGLLIAAIGFFIKNTLAEIKCDLKELRKDSSSLKDDLAKKSIALETILHDKQSLFDKLNNLEKKVEKDDEHIIEFYKEYKNSLDFLKENHHDLHAVVQKHKTA